MVVYILTCLPGSAFLQIVRVSRESDTCFICRGYDSFIGVSLVDVYNRNLKEKTLNRVLGGSKIKQVIFNLVPSYPLMDT